MSLPACMPVCLYTLQRASADICLKLAHKETSLGCICRRLGPGMRIDLSAIVVWYMSSVPHATQRVSRVPPPAHDGLCILRASGAVPRRGFRTHVHAATCSCRR